MYHVESRVVECGVSSAMCAGSSVKCKVNSAESEF